LKNERLLAEKEEEEASSKMKNAELKALGYNACVGSS
jgi:hypothetical protein